VIAGAIATGVITYLAITNRPSGAATLETLKRFSALALGGAFALAVVQNALQTTRLWLLLPGARRLPWWSIFRSFSLGQFVNNYVPARAGDFVKIALVKSATREQTVASLAGSILIADKIADIGSLLILLAVSAPALLGQLTTKRLTPPSPVWWLLPAVVGCLLYLLWRAFRARFGEAIVEVVRGLSALVKFRSLLLAVTVGTAAWLAETAILISLASCVDVHLTPSEAIGVLAVLNVGIAVPVSFANVGIFEGAVAFGLTRVGVPATTALAVAAVHHFIQVGTTTVLAAAFAAFSRPKQSANEFRVRPIDKHRAIEYYDGLSGHYDENAGRGLLKFMRARERRAILGFARLDEAPKKRMIDVGCGGGYYALSAKRAGLHVSVVDVAPGMIEVLKEKAHDARCCDIENLSLEQTYDIVICSGVLDFVLHPEIAFKNLAALIAPGGRLVVQAPRSGLFGWIYRAEKKLLRIEVNLFSLDWFETQAEKQGLILFDYSHPLPTNRVLLFQRPA
jgi:2-polyprenyl-3-methyl-5-hydroxy-6-metoxy-1,4-benzoquinol methylase/uncharacterized membrane protein YbhN (UPF0104 family)